MQKYRKTLLAIEPSTVAVVDIKRNKNTYLFHCLDTNYKVIC